MELKVAKKKARRKQEKPESKITLVVSDDPSPRIEVRTGTKIEVVAVDFMESETSKPAKVAARLCGGTSTCLALIETE